MRRAGYGLYGYDQTQWRRAGQLPGCRWYANAQTVEAGFRIILKDPKVKAILINIFGGIVRCDRVAQGGSTLITPSGISKSLSLSVSRAPNAEEAQKLKLRKASEGRSASCSSEAAALVNKAVA